MNIKTGLYCIPLSPEDIYLSRDEILFFAKNPVSKKAISDGELFSLDGFDGYLDDEDVSFIDSIDSFKDGDVLFTELPKCMAYSLAQGDSGFQERFGIITALRDLCYSKGDAKEILKKYLTPKKYKHCVYEERQLDYLYERHDLLFPSCATLKAQGFCVSGCKGQNIYL